MALGLSYPTASGILVPPPGLKLVSPALESGFLTTGPPRKALKYILFIDIKCKRSHLRATCSQSQPFFGIVMKTELSSSVATAEFSKFAGISSAAISQHQYLGF